MPVWATLIALMDDDAVVLGLVSAPALQPPLVGRARLRRLDRPEPVVGDPDAPCPRWPPLDDASLSYSSLAGWDERRPVTRLPRADPASCWRTRAYGDFWSYMLVAEGAVDIATEPELALHDMAALVDRSSPRPAAGSPTSTAPTARRAATRVATNGRLHDEVLQRLTP